MYFVIEVTDLLSIDNNPIKLRTLNLVLVKLPANMETCAFGVLLHCMRKEAVFDGCLPGIGHLVPSAKVIQHLEDADATVAYVLTLKLLVVLYSDSSTDHFVANGVNCLLKFVLLPELLMCPFLSLMALALTFALMSELVRVSLLNRTQSSSGLWMSI